MVQLYKVDIEFPHKSGLPADADHCGLYFSRGVLATPTDFDNAHVNIQQFFNATPTGMGSALNLFLSAALAKTPTLGNLTFYEVPATPGPLGAPVAIRTWALAALATDGLPNEVSACLSYQRLYGTDVEFGSGGTRPRARDRGRMYLPPLSGITLTQDATTKEQRFDNGFLDVLTQAASDQLHDAMLADDWIWVQFSHTTWTHDAVTRCWVDNAPDIQRRRGVLPTHQVSVTF